MKTVGAIPVRRVVTYAACLAINQNAPNIALEILSLSGVNSYVTVRNLKVCYIVVISWDSIGFFLVFCFIL